MRPFVVAGVLLTAGGYWAARLILDPDPLAPAVGIVVGLDLLAVTVVAAAGLLLSRGVWSRRLSLAVVAAGAAASALPGLDPWGAAGLALAAVSLLLLAGPWLEGWLRQLPPAAAPPTRATLLALALLVAPGVIALSSPSDLTPWHAIAAGLAAVTAYAYARAWTAGLISARLAVPLAGAGAAVFSPPGGAVVLGLFMVAVAALAWSRDARLAVAPLAPRRVSGVAVPPQLVPPDVLAAAGFDERGRPRETT